MNVPSMVLVQAYLRLSGRVCHWTGLGSPHLVVISVPTFHVFQLLVGEVLESKAHLTPYHVLVNFFSLVIVFSLTN